MSAAGAGRTSQRTLTVADLDRFLGVPAESAELTACLNAAAVLAAFDPRNLRPVGQHVDGPPVLPDGLLTRCEPFSAGTYQGLWSLVLPERRTALRRLKEHDGLARALAANPDRPDTPVQRVFERLVLDPESIPRSAEALAGMPRAELAALHTLHDWVDGILPGLPERSEVVRALSWSDLVQPLRRLTGRRFVGRRAELDQLTGYVFGPPPPHRPDVRRLMPEDLTDHVPAGVVEAIDRAAVAYYQRQPGAAAATEELYHRLRLGETGAALDRRWSPAVADRLKGAMEELPARQRLWLAARMGVSVDPAVRRTANQEDWEQQAAVSAEQALASGAAERALDVLHERADRLPRSRLYRLEVESHRALGHWDEALAVGRAGVDAATGDGAVDQALELLLHLVVIEEGRGRLDSARRLVAEAAAVARHSSNEVLRFRVSITELRLLRRSGQDTDGKSAPPTEQDVELTESLRRELRSRPMLLREAAAELGEFDPQLTSAAIETLGVEVSDDRQAEALGHAIVEALASAVIPASESFVEGAEQFTRTDFDPGQIRAWVTTEMTGRDTRTLGRSLADAESGGDVLKGFQTYFRAGVDLSLSTESDGETGLALPGEQGGIQ